MNTVVKIILLVGLIIVLALGINMVMKDKKEDRLGMLDEAKQATVMIINIVDRSKGLVGQGSGAIISEDGYIVSNNHVTEGAEKLYVILNDHRVYDAEIIGAFPDTDLSLLKIDAPDLVAFDFYNDPIQNGQEVYGIGSPLGLEQTITYGVISFLKRDDHSPNSLTYYIQSNLACNPGNSGGPLVSTDGELMGINSWIRVDRVGEKKEMVPNTSFCFSVPSRVVQYVVDHLKENAKIRSKTIDAAYEQMTLGRALKSGFDKLVGVEISQVEKGGIADKAGLKEGDVLYVFNDEEINSSLELKAEVTLSPEEDNSTLKVWRNGEELELELTPEYNYTDTEFVYKSIKEAHQSCSLDAQCIRDHLDNIANTQKNRYLQQLIQSVVKAYDKELDSYKEHAKQCQGDAYTEARDAMAACHVQVYDDKINGKASKIGDKDFKQCLHDKLSALSDNEYAKAGVDLLGLGEENQSQEEHTPEAESEQVSTTDADEAGEDTGASSPKDCMMYWIQ